MAANSPVQTVSGGTGGLAAAASSSNGVGSPNRRLDTPRPNLRGLNKPKCIKCGNVARSRCPYQSCKSCCAKAQNPCHIHVLKSNSILPDKLPNSTSPSDKSVTDTSPLGNSFRVNSLRQIPNNFARFIGPQSSLRSRRPLTRKDAAEINTWRFSKLKECTERNIEAETEAFDRYMQNVTLLEEIFSISSPPGDITLDNEDIAQEMISGIKVRLKARAQRTESSRERIHIIVDEGLKDLQKWECVDNINVIDDLKELKRPKKELQCGADRIAAVDELMEKLNKARTEDDLNSCVHLKSHLFGQTSASLSGSATNESKDAQVASLDAKATNESQNCQVTFDENAGGAPTLKLVTLTDNFSKSIKTIRIGQEALSAVEKQFIFLGEVVEL